MNSRTASQSVSNNLSATFVIIFTFAFPLFDSSTFYGLLILATLIVVLPLLLLRVKNIKVSRFVLTCYLVFWCGSSFGMFYSVISGLDVSFQNLFEYLKVPYYALVFYFLYSIYLRDNKVGRIHLDVIFWLVVALAIFSLMIPQVGLLYTSDKMVRIGRASAPFINPYSLAFFLSFFVFFFAIRLFIKSTDRVKNQIYLNLLGFGISGYLLLLTQSRSILLSVFVMFFFLPLFVFFVMPREKKRQYFRKLFPLMVIACSLIFAIIKVAEILNLRYSLELLELATEANLRASGSVDVRVEQIKAVFGYIAKLPFSVLFGFGPAKDEFRLLESGYAYIFYRHGLIGLFLYGLLLFYLIKSAVFLFKYCGDPFWLACSVFWVALPLSLSSSMHVEHPKVSFFVLALLAIQCAFHRNARGN